MEMGEVGPHRYRCRLRGLLMFEVRGGEQAVYFVSGDGQHAAVLQITWLVNVLLTVYLYAFFRRWTRGELVRPGGGAQQAD